MDDRPDTKCNSAAVKRPLRVSALASLGITSSVAAINFATSFIMGHPLFAMVFEGGEVNEWWGVGVMYCEYFPLMDASAPTSYSSSSVEFEPASFLGCWLLLFVASLVFSLRRARRRG